MKLRITIDGKIYEAEVEVLEDDEVQEPASEPSYRAAQSTAGSLAQNPEGAWSEDGKLCHSPVMGLVVRVHVAPGQVVAAGAPVLVLEAMKMETNLTAPRAGTVKTVHVQPGDSVKNGQMLLEFEPA